MKLQYKTADYDEFAMMAAVLECCQNPFKQKEQVAQKHGVPKTELIKEFIANRARTYSTLS